MGKRTRARERYEGKRKRPNDPKVDPPSNRTLEKRRREGDKGRGKVK